MKRISSDPIKFTIPVSVYKGNYLAEWPDGVDAVDQTTGKWRFYRSVHAAKRGITAKVAHRTPLPAAG